MQPEPPAAGATSSPPKQSALRTAAAGLIGNVLEWFDYAVYGYFSTEIGKQFTPAPMAKDDKELIALSSSGSASPRARSAGWSSAQWVTGSAVARC
jgi:hypothetical protein